MTETKLPKDLLFNQDYSWVKIDGNSAVLGVIKPAADKVKEFVFIKLPQKGKVLKQGETYVSLEALKWSGHLSSPLSGEIVEVNDSLFDNPSTINNDPYGAGWVIKIKLSNPEETKQLSSSSQAGEWISQGMQKRK